MNTGKQNLDGCYNCGVKMEFKTILIRHDFNWFFFLMLLLITKDIHTHVTKTFGFQVRCFVVFFSVEI